MLSHLAIGGAMPRSHARIIEAAHAGEAGHLVFAFVAADPEDRARQITDVLSRLHIVGLAIRVLLNPRDAKGQPIPVEAEGRFRTWGSDSAVPVGEFHLAISRVQ
jgi:hypothetical protein